MRQPRCGLISSAIPKQRFLFCTGLVHEPVKGFFSNDDQVFRVGVVAGSKADGYGYIFSWICGRGRLGRKRSRFLSVGQGIEPVQPIDGQPKPLSLRIRRARTEETLASLARHSRLPDKNAEGLRRLLNRRYPTGEPVAGELIKIIE